MPDVDAPSRASRRTLVGICLTVGGSITVVASFNYMLTPMLEDLGRTMSQAPFDCQCRVMLQSGTR